MSITFYNDSAQYMLSAKSSLTHVGQNNHCFLKLKMYLIYFL
jgi:hypothetical protein